MVNFFRKVVHLLRWFFAFTKEASLEFIKYAPLTNSEFDLLKDAYLTQCQKRNEKPVNAIPEKQISPKKEPQQKI